VLLESHRRFALRRSVVIPILPGFLTLSSRGPGHRPFTAVTRVRIPLGSQYLFICKSGVVSVATLSYLLVQPLAGHLADKIDIAKTVFGGLLLAALAIIAVTFTARRHRHRNRLDKQRRTREYTGQ
jgi:MFS family permease